MTERKTKANRANAALSTGPRTSAGKAKSSRNALQHGLRSTQPVIVGVEESADWEAHRAGVFADVAPQSVLEECLAERVALLLWRLGRVTRYETAVIAAAQPEANPETDNLFATLSPTNPARAVADAEAAVARAETGVADLKAQIELVRHHLTVAGELDGNNVWCVLETAWAEIDERRRLPALDSPEFARVAGLSAALTGDDFPADDFRRGLGYLAVARAENLPAFTARVEDALVAERADLVTHLETQRSHLDEARERVRLATERRRAHVLLPDRESLDKLLRYEAHLSRQLFQTLHELERRKAARHGSVPPPLVVEVNGTTVAD